MNKLQRIIVSAAVELDRRGVPITADAVARQVLDYHAGARMPLLSSAQASRVLNDDDDGELSGLGLFGIGKKLKKIFHKVEDVVKPIIAPVASVAATVYGGPAAGAAVANAFGNYQRAKADGKSAAEQQKLYDEYLAAQAQAEAAEPTVVGIPQRYIPWLIGGAGGLLAIYLVTKK